MCAVVMISSGCVTSMNLSRLRSTVFGEPTAEHKRVMLAEAFSAGGQDESMSSVGGGIWPGGARRRFVEGCWTGVERKRGRASGLAAVAFRASLAGGRASWPGGLKG